MADERRPLLNPVLRFTKDPKPESITGRGKSLAGIKTARLDGQRRKLSSDLMLMARDQAASRNSPTARSSMPQCSRIRWRRLGHRLTCSSRHMARDWLRRMHRAIWLRWTCGASSASPHSSPISVPCVTRSTSRASSRCASLRQAMRWAAEQLMPYGKRRRVGHKAAPSLPR